MRFALLALFAFALSVNIVAFDTDPSSASTAGFSAGEIIDDGVMTNSNSMTASQVQQFLNSKVPTCDTNGQQLSEYGGPDLNGDGKVQRWEWAKNKYGETKFICLKDKTVDGKSAAQVIVDKAKKYSINPQSLIVLLQKEQGLVTDTWPVNIQYKTATGYGCPDTAPCDTQYYGLANQLDWAARMFRSIISQDPNWYSPYFKGTNPTVYYHPDTSRCGSTSLSIKNWSTAALYSYTPYRPNQAALNAGYGQGDSCSAYGNRNFYLYFKDWFGSPNIPNVFRSSSSSQAYLLDSEGYYKINSIETLYAYGFDRNDIKVVSNSVINSLTNKGPLKTVTRFNGSDSIYVIDRGRYFRVPTREVFADYGYSFGDEINLVGTVTTSLSNSGDLSTVIDVVETRAKYTVESGKKRHISSPAAYKTVGSPVYASRTPVGLSQTYVNTLPLGTPVLEANSFAQDADTQQVNFWDGATIQPIDSAVFNNLGFPKYNGKNVKDLPISTRGTIGSLVKYNTSYYLLDNKLAYTLTDAIRTQIGLTDTTSFIPVSDGFASRLAPIARNFTPVTRLSGSNAIFLVENKKLYLVRSRAALDDLGYTVGQASNLNAVSQKLFSKSPQHIYEQGKLLRVNNTSPVYIITPDNKRLHIPSRAIMESFGFTMSSVINVSDKEIGRYTNVAALSFIVKSVDESVYFVEGKTKRPMDNTLLSSPNYNIDKATIPVVSSRTLNSLATSSAMTNLVRAYGENKVYKIENGRKRWVQSREAFTSSGFSFSNVRSVPPAYIDSVPNGSDIR